MICQLGGGCRIWPFCVENNVKPNQSINLDEYDDVIKWKHFLRYWPFARGIHRSLVNSPHKGQWCGALMFSLICAWINGCVNNRKAGDSRSHHAHYDVIVINWSLTYCRVIFLIFFFLSENILFLITLLFYPKGPVENRFRSFCWCWNRNNLRQLLVGLLLTV